MAKRSTTQKEIDALNARSAALEDQAEEKARAGDVDGYMKDRTEADLCRTELYVKRQQLENLQTMPEEQAIEAWADFARPVSNELKRRLEAYKEARKKLYAQYVDMMELMASGCRTRSLYIGAVGGKPGDIEYLGKYGPMFPIELVSYEDVGPDGHYFSRTKTAPYDEAHRFDGMAMTGGAYSN